MPGPGGLPTLNPGTASVCLAAAGSPLPRHKRLSLPEVVSATGARQKVVGPERVGGTRLLPGQLNPRLFAGDWCMSLG